MRTVAVRDNMRIPLGRQGENGAVRIVWPGIIESYTKLYGAGGFSLVVRRPGDSAPYPAAVAKEGADLVWTIGSADTAKDGYGNAELTYTVGGVIAKSQTWGTIVNTSLSGQEPTDPPEPQKSWVDEVLTAGAAAEASAGNAQKAAAEAADSADEAAKAAQAAANAAAGAGNAAQAAQAAASAAVDAKTAAQTAHAAAEDAQDAAETAKTGAESAKTAAESAQEAAQTSAAAAAGSAATAQEKAAEAAQEAAKLTNPCVGTLVAATEAALLGVSADDIGKFLGVGADLKIGWRAAT